MKKILVIDDDREFVAELNEILNDEGYEVFNAYGGETGLELFMQIHPDLVLLDMKLPKLNGAQVLPLIKNKCKEVPVLMISARPQQNELRQLGANGFIPKPFDVQFALSAICSALE